MHPSRMARALLLDLDGTIADTLPLCFDAYRHAVAPWVDQPPTEAEVEATFGPAEREGIARMVPAAHLDEAEARFHEYYEAHLGRRARVVEGLAAVIDHARSLGWRVGVFTGKGRRSAQFTLRELGLFERVEHLISSDDVSRPKPDPEGVHQASQVLGVPVGRVLFAGDTPGDIQAGRAAGATTAAVLWAAYRPERLRETGADFICETVAELELVIDRLNSGP
jgi:HAD superfamily hydrolase (TIGR01509 family)